MLNLISETLTSGDVASFIAVFIAVFVTIVAVGVTWNKSNINVMRK